MNWRDRLGLITVTVGGSQAVGTGFWVTRNRVLTARHVFADAGDWKIQPVNGYPVIKLDASMIRWKGEDPLDVVVLEVEHPDSRLSEPLKFSRRIFETQRCETSGFASISARSPAEPLLDGSLCPLSGNLHPSTEKATILNFTVEQGWENIEQLGGVSGAPLMIKGQLYGIVKGGPKELKGRRLDIIDIHRALGPGFLEALGFPKVEGRATTLSDKAKGLLLNEDVLARELAKEIAMKLGKSGKTWKVERLIAELRGNVKVGDLLSILKVIQKRAIDAGNLSKISRIRDLGLLLVPLVFWRDIKFERARITADFMSLPFFNKVTAEIVQAAYDGRKLELIPVADGSLRLEKAIVAPTPPESGASSSQEEEDFLRMLLDALVDDPRLASRYLTVVRDGVDSSDGDERKKRLIKMIDHGLKGDRDLDTIYYLIVERKTKIHYGRHAETVLMRLRKSVPNLRVVVLDGEDDDFDEEGFTLVDLQQFYRLCHSVA